MMKKPKSSRADGRGGRVKGVRTNPDCGWTRTLRDLIALLGEHRGKRGAVSAKALARAVGCHGTTVLRWIGPPHDRPCAETQRAVREWVADRRAEIRRGEK